MGVFASGGSPSNRRKRRSSSSSQDLQDPERSRSRSPKRRKRASRERKSRDSKRRGERNKEKFEKTEVCKMFMLGKCPKSPERCPFSHDAEPTKIMELCKFYLLERCAKREKCLYLHKGFPCKYFHTGHRYEISIFLFHLFSFFNVFFLLKKKFHL